MTGWSSGSRGDPLDAIEATGTDQAYASQHVAAMRSLAATDAERLGALRRTIESEIIPRLMVACRGTTPEPIVATARACALQDRVGELTGFLLDGDMAGVAGVVGRALHEGASQPAILLDLFAPAARRLGELWESDERDFTEVTIAMGCLQQALRIFDPPGRHLPSGLPQRTIFLTPCDGEQHYFGVRLLDVFFSGGDWNVTSRLVFDRKQACTFVSKRHVDVVGISISRESLLERLASDIELLRRKSRNKSLVVLVGGRVLAGRSELLEMLGADATAEDGISAVLVAGRLVSGQDAATA